jgi:peroxiredoxin
MKAPWCGRRRVRGAGALLAAALLAGPLAQAEAEQPKPLTLREIVDRAARSVVQVTATSGSMTVALGSGFVIDPKGYVATNYHVVRQGTGAFVQFRDGSKWTVKGYRALDRAGDIAILELEKRPPGVQALPLALNAPSQGDGVIAIGHPQGLSFTVTTGIVSAVRKTSELPKETRDFIRTPGDWVWVQTSAPISSGNSGGPLLDDAGRVIGINTWIADGQNLGFAVHIRHVADILARSPAKLLPLTPEKYARDEENPLAKIDPRVQEMIKEYRQAEREFRQLLEGAEDDKAARKIWETQHPGPKYAKRFLEIADSERKTTATFQALCLACRFDSASKHAKYLRQALGRLAEDHATDRGLHHGLRLIVTQGQPAVLPFLRQVIDKSPHRRVRGISSLVLAILLEAGTTRDEAEVVRLLNACLKEYKDVAIEGGMLGEDAEGKLVGDLAGPLLHKVHCLSVGKTPPEITGQDVEGKAFKLSDYQGKVVLLDFFADWCPHCTRMYPHERELVTRYAGKPFALLGVNSESKDTLHQLVGAKTVTWRCWSDGQQGPIAAAWQVESFPTIYLLDKKGIIRRIFHGRPEERELDQAIEAVLGSETKR